MRKKYFFVAALALLFSSCSEENLQKNGDSIYDGQTLYANLQGESQSRISISGLSLSWEKGDIFTVYDNDGVNATNYQLESGEGTKAGKFQAVTGGTSQQPAIAVFPNLSGSLKNNALSVTLPDAYDAAKSQNAPMIGTLEGNTVNFKHSVAIIKFNLTNMPEGYTSLKVTADEVIAGQFKITDITAGNMTLVKDNTEGKTVTINGISNGKLFYLPIPATTIKKLDIKLGNGSDERQLATIENKTYNCGTLYTFTKDKLEEQDLYTVIMNRVREAKKKTISSSTIDKYLGLIKEDGSFSDIDYNQTQNSSWQPAYHYDRLFEMSLAYSDKANIYYNNDKLYNNIIKAMEYWYNRNPKTGSWWYYEIGIPQKISLALIHMRYGVKQVPADLEKKLLDRINSKNNGFGPARPDGGRTGANLTDICLHWIYRSCLQKNEADMKKSLEYSFKPLAYVTGEGIQLDNSYFQHENQLYIGSYGNVLLDGVTSIASYVEGTPFALQGTRLDVLSKFMRETFFQVIRGKYMAFDVLGRAVSRPHNTSQSGTATFAKRMITLDPEHKSEFEDLAQRISGSDPSYGVKPMHTHYYIGDYTLHVRPKYTFDVRMVSDRTIRCERRNNENIKGYHISDGCTNILVNGDEYYDIFPIWNWTRIPGVTAPQSTEPPFLSEVRERGKPKFAGGVSDGLYGATGFSYYDAEQGINTGTNKSWYFFDDEVVCLGNVKSASSKKVQTTINQCWGKGKTVTVKTDASSVTLGKEERNFVNPTWVHHNNVGYIFPQGGNVWVSNVTQKGSWKSINEGYSSAVESGNVFSLGFDYNSVANYTPYSYIVVPGINSTSEVEEYMSKNAIQIVSNTEKVQSVYHRNLKKWQIVFFAPGTLKFDELDLEVTVDRGCAVMLSETATAGRYDVYVADPERTNQVIALTFKNSKGKSKTLKSRVYGLHNGKTQKVTPPLKL